MHVVTVRDEPWRREERGGPRSGGSYLCLLLNRGDVLIWASFGCGPDLALVRAVSAGRAATSAVPQGTDFKVKPRCYRYTTLAELSHQIIVEHFLSK